MNRIILGAVVICVALWGVYTIGKRDSEVTVRVNPLVVASCVDIAAFAPVNNTFGATTLSLTNLAGQYRACRAACVKLP